MRLCHVFAVTFSLLTFMSASSGRAQFAESLVRAPELRPPEAASLAGAYAKTAFGALDVARGTFALPGPFVLPQERAQPGIALTPGYSPENGLGEWGLGWSVRLEIRRFRALGELGFDEHDDLDTPWGRAVRGLDGTYYMHGLASRMLIRNVQGDLVATAPDGTRYTFTGAAGIESALLRSAHSPEDVQSEVSAFDPVTDAIAQMERDRGGNRYVADDRFDGRERLRALWDNTTGTSEDRPSLSIDYRDPTQERPGVVARTLDLGDGQAQIRLAEYFTASGDLIATAVLGLDSHERENLTFSDARFGLRNTGVAKVVKPAPLASAFTGVFDVSYDDLRAGPELETRAATGFGASRWSSRLVQQGVTQRVESTRTLTADGVLTVTTENGAFVERVLSDVDGRVLARTDEEGFVTRMDYDALGRLALVTLSSGESQGVGYDSLGRLVRLHRDGLGETTYHYLFGTMLLEGKTVSDGFGHVERSVLYQLDHAGRVIEELHTLVDSGEQDSLRYEYDGAIDGVVRHPGQRGHLTRVVGEGFDRRLVYDVADRLVRTEMHFPGFRSLVETATYFANGADRTRTVDLADEAGETLETIRQMFHYDAHGRPRSHEVNGRTLFETYYGDRGEIERVAGPHGTTYYHYDSSTLRERGLTHTTTEQTTDLGWEYDARGHVAAEDYGVDDADTRTRAFAYSPRGFVTRVEDDSASETYGYDALGRRNAAQDLHGARAQVRSADSITLGLTDYQYDTLGRLIARRGAQGVTAECYAGRLVASTEGMRFEGTITVAGDAEFKLKHPAFLGSKAFARLDFEAARFSLNLKSGELSSAGMSVGVSAGLRYNKEAKLGSAEGKLRAEIGIAGRFGVLQPDSQVNVTAYGRVRAEASIGAWRRRDEANVALRLYDSRAAPH